MCLQGRSCRSRWVCKREKQLLAQDQNSSALSSTCGRFLFSQRSLKVHLKHRRRFCRKVRGPGPSFALLEALRGFWLIHLGKRNQHEVCCHFAAQTACWMCLCALSGARQQFAVRM